MVRGVEGVRYRILGQYQSGQKIALLGCFFNRNALTKLVDLVDIADIIAISLLTIFCLSVFMFYDFWRGSLPIHRFACPYVFLSVPVSFKQ